jgi:hypothetical protein
MIFNNYVTAGTVLTSTIWNRAWGFEGTAKSLYDSIGAQQYASNIYGAFSWASAIQSLTTYDEVIQFSFITGSTYQSSERAGSLNNWRNGMLTNTDFFFTEYSDFRDRITIQRDGYYLIHAEFSINDSSNRICSSTDANGVTTVPDRSIEMIITVDVGLGLGDVVERSSAIRPNVVNSATYNVFPNVAPHGSVVLNFIETYRKGDTIKLKTNVVTAGRDERIINAGLKAFLIKAIEVDNSNFDLY